MPRPSGCSFVLVSLVALLSLSLCVQDSLVQGKKNNNNNVVDGLVPKQLAGHPNEFVLNQLPEPIEGAITSTSAMLVAIASASLLHPGTAEARVDLTVDSSTSFAFTVLTQPSQQSNLQLRLFHPDGIEFRDLNQFGTPSQLQIGSDLVNTTTYTFNSPTQGIYRLELIFHNWKLDRSTDQVPLNPFARLAANLGEEPNEISAVIYVDNDSPIKIFSHVNTYHQIETNPIGLVASLYDSSIYTDDFLRANPKLRPPALVFENPSDVIVELIIILPNGNTQIVQMFDNGKNSDLYANDGVYGASITPPTTGSYFARSSFTVNTTSVSPNNQRSPYFKKAKNIVRSAQHILAVVGDALTLGTSATAVVDTNQTRIDLQLQLVAAEQDEDRIFRVYAEVYGANASNPNQQIPVSWVATLAEVQFSGPNSSNPYLELQLQRQWLVYSNVVPPLVLKNVVVQDLDNQVIISNQDLISVTFSDQSNVEEEFFRHSPGYDGVSITEEMKKGKRPEQFARNTEASSFKLMMVHGYCSEKNPFTLRAADFDDAIYFLSPKSSDSNDDFARKLVAFAQAEGVTSFSAIGHSQGGMAITHLRNYYWSGIDVPTNGRLLQSLSTPYLGAAVAGNLAGIGKAIGVGCGSNYDLSRDGAALWIKGITADTLNDLYYYYVQYGSSPVYCNQAANMLMSKPNDGTTEVDYAQPPGAHFAGFHIGECHIEGMKYPAVFLNETRNAELNTLAARS